MGCCVGWGWRPGPPRLGPARAREAPPSMVAGMAVAAAACVMLALLPSVIAPALRRAVAALPAARAAQFTDFGTLIRLPGMQGSIAPAVIAAALGIAALTVAAVAQWRRGRRPRAAALPLWACGADDLTARMQYTATSFAEPLQRVFDDVLRPDTDIEITHTDESQYFADKIVYRTRVADAIEKRFYSPVVQVVAAAAAMVRDRKSVV